MRAPAVRADGTPHKLGKAGHYPQADELVEALETKQAFLQRPLGHRARDLHYLPIPGSDLHIHLQPVKGLAQSLIRECSLYAKELSLLGGFDLYLPCEKPAVVYLGLPPVINPTAADAALVTSHRPGEYYHLKDESND